MFERTGEARPCDPDDLRSWPAGATRPPLDLPRALRPRERLQTLGVQVLSLRELLMLVIGSGSRSETLPGVADRLLRRHGLRRLRELGEADWRRERGLGTALAARLSAAFELGRRAWVDSVDEPARLNGPREAFAQVRELGRSKKEHLVGLYLDAQNGLICKETISIGTLNTTRTHPREILYPAVTHLALGFILAHNHPSGCPDPSGEDVEFTQAIRRAGEMMGIELYDHLIVTRDGYTSLRERGLL